MAEDHKSHTHTSTITTVTDYSDRDNNLPLHDVICRETQKIIKIKIENDLKEKQLKDAVEDLKNTNEVQKNNIIQLQMEQEKLNDKLCHEQRLREITMNKVATTRNLCTILENSFKELSDTFKHCKNNRDMIQEAYDNATNVLMEIKKKNEKSELQLKQKIQEMENLIASEKNNKNEHEKLLKDMNTTCEQLKKQIFVLSDYNKKLQQEKNELACALAEKKDNILQMERSLEAEKDRSFTLCKDLSALSDEFSQRKIEMDSLVDNYQKQIENLNMHLDQLKYDYEIKDEIIEKQKKDTNILVADYQKQIQILHKQLQETRNENSGFNKKIIELVSEKEILVGQIKQFEKEDIVKNDLIEELQMKVTDFKNEISEMNKINLEYQQKTGDINTNFETLNKQNQELKNLMNNLQTEKASLESNLHNSVKSLQDKINILQQEKNNMYEEMQSAKEKLNEKIGEHDKIKTSLKSQQSQSKKTENELQKLRKESKNKTDQLESTINKLNEEIQKKNGVLTNLLDELKTNQDEIENMKSVNSKKLNALDAHIDSLKETIMERENCLKMIREENSELKKKLKNVEAINAEKAVDVLNENGIDPKPASDQETSRKSQPTSFAMPKIRKISDFKTPQAVPNTTKKFNPVPNSPGTGFLSDSSSDGYVFDAEKIKFKFNQYCKGDLLTSKSLPGIPIKRVYKRKTGQNVSASQNGKKSKEN